MRRLASLLGILAIVVLVLMLFWSVFLHHEATESRGTDETVQARVKIAIPRR
jgi:hypothetical protein